MEPTRVSMVMFANMRATATRGIAAWTARTTITIEIRAQATARSQGTYVGRQGLYNLAGKAMSITGGTFHEEIEDVLANDDHSVALARHRFIRDGRTKDYRTAHAYEVKAGKLAQCFAQPRDPASFEDAWDFRRP